MTKGVKPIHSRQMKRRQAGHNQDNIDENNPFGDIADFGHKLLVDIRVFPLENLHASNAQERQHCNCKDDDTDAAETVKDCAPQ